MKEGWVLIFSSPDLLEVKLAEDVLKQNDIESHIIDTADSAFLLGDAELYTLPQNEKKALEVLRDNDMVE